MPLIEFQLTNLRSVGAWGQGRDRLHWFGLTDGRYWLKVGDEELFRYDEPDVAYVDYYVARLWEDLLDLLPRVLHEVPADIAPAIESPTGARTGVLGRFWQTRFLDGGYLVNAPRIWIWSTGGRTRVIWDNRPPADATEPRWLVTSGSYELPTSDFVDELRDFDHRLMAAMRDRVAEVLAGGLDPAIVIDLPNLRAEHDDRATWLARALSTDPASRARSSGAPTWDEIRVASGLAARG